MWSHKLFVHLMIGLQVTTVLACNNYQLVVNKMETCSGKSSLITFKDFNLTMTDDCRIIPSGCIDNKKFETAMVKYTISKFPVPMAFSGEFDACEEMKSISQDTVAILQTLKTFTKCPAKEGHLCGDKNSEVNISQYKEFLQHAVGRLRVELNIKHNTGVSCLKMDISIGKKGAEKRRGMFKKMFGKKKN